MIHVSAVIVSWNKEDLTLDTLNSLSESLTNGFELEIVLVDNASKDKTVEKVRNFFKKLSQKGIRTKLIVNKTNLGFAHGNNIGMQYAMDNDADYVLLLNDDTTVEKNMLSGLVSFALENKDAGALTPKIYFSPGFEFHKGRYKEKDRGKVIWYAGGKMDWKNVYGSNFGVDEVDKGQFEEVRKIDFASGCCVLLPTNVLRKTGLFDPKYFAYLEDVDLSIRIKKEGYHLYFVPVAFMWHKVSQSSAIGSSLNDYFISRNRMLLGFKYATARTKFALFRESIRLLMSGREWQKTGIKDFYFGKYGVGSWVK